MRLELRNNLFNFTPCTLSLNNFANILNFKVETNSRSNETGGFVNLFTVENRTQGLLPQLEMISEKKFSLVL